MTRKKLFLCCSWRDVDKAMGLSEDIHSNQEEQRRDFFLSQHLYYEATQASTGHWWDVQV
jgi:hypothetical protein